MTLNKLEKAKCLEKNLLEVQIWPDLRYDMYLSYSAQIHSCLVIALSWSWLLEFLEYHMNMEEAYEKRY